MFPRVGAARLSVPWPGLRSGSRISSLVADGMVEMTPLGRIRVTAEGFPVLDAVVADLAG